MKELLENKGFYGSISFLLMGEENSFPWIFFHPLIAAFLSLPYFFPLFELYFCTCLLGLRRGKYKVLHLVQMLNILEIFVTMSNTVYTLLCLSASCKTSTQIVQSTVFQFWSSCFHEGKKGEWSSPPVSVILPQWPYGNGCWHVHFIKQIFRGPKQQDQACLQISTEVK